ncbi:MAG TPA: hypothetical protein PKE16_18870, partial [Hyphomicrobium sp.]|nr:hypothetical protein [Hyphomicrobium sp.]
VLASRLLLEFPVNFFKYYVVRRHIMGGFKGLRYALIQASYRQVKIFHMWRARNARSGVPAPGPSLLSHTEAESSAA